MLRNKSNSMYTPIALITITQLNINSIDALASYTQLNNSSFLFVYHPLSFNSLHLFYRLLYNFNKIRIRLDSITSPIATTDRVLTTPVKCQRSLLSVRHFNLGIRPYI